MEKTRLGGTAGIAALLALGGVACTLSPREFERQRYKVGDARLCRTWFDAVEKRDEVFAARVREEVDRRGLDRSSCDEAIRAQNRNIVAGVAAAVAVAAIAADRHHGGGGTVHRGRRDTEWDWDRFRDEHGNLVWACRGVQTGEFAPLESCRYKVKDDDRWPGPNPPR